MPGGDAETLAFYTREAQAYADMSATDADSPHLKRFAAMLPAGGTVLDFGCGPGWAADRFQTLGFAVTATDGSEGLAAEARRRYGIDVAVARFEDLDDVAAYDGIWASFCLLHDSREAMPGHLARLCRALRPGGAIYIGLKEGTGMHRDRLNRRYTYFTEAEMNGLMTTAGFSDPACDTDRSAGMSGEVATCIHLFARRPA